MTGMAIPQPMHKAPPRAPEMTPACDGGNNRIPGAKAITRTSAQILAQG